MIWTIAALLVATAAVTDNGDGSFSIRVDNTSPSNEDGAYCAAYDLAVGEGWVGVRITATGEGANVYELDVEEGDTTDESDHTLSEIAETYSCDEDPNDEG